MADSKSDLSDQVDRFFSINRPPRTGTAQIQTGNTIEVRISDMSAGHVYTASIFEYDPALASPTTTGLGQRVSTQVINTPVTGVNAINTMIPVGFTVASPTENNKFVLVEDFLPDMTPTGVASGYAFMAAVVGSGSTSTSIERPAERCKYCEGPVPVAWKLELTGAVMPGDYKSVGKINQVHLVQHAVGCLWLGQEIQLGPTVKAQWKLEKVDAGTWRLDLRKKSGLLVSYEYTNKASKKCGLDFEMVLMANGTEFMNWPKSVKVSPG